MFNTVVENVVRTTLMDNIFDCINNKYALNKMESGI